MGSISRGALGLLDFLGLGDRTRIGSHVNEGLVFRISVKGVCFGRFGLHGQDFYVWPTCCG